MSSENYCLEGEEWRDIEGYAGLYQVSDRGAVKSLARDVPIGDHGFCHHDERIMSCHSNGHGYLRVMLSKDGEKTNKYVHRLVAEAFLVRPDGMDYVDHVDGNRSNNAASNLRYCTQRQNIHYSIESGRLSTEENIKHLQTDEAKRAQRDSARKPVLRSDGVMFESANDAAKEMGCTRQAVSRAARGESKTCNGYAFKYV